MRIFLATLGLAFSGAASACLVPPQDIHRAHDTLVSEATSILLVKAISESSAGCSFQIVRVLKGRADASSIACHLSASDDWMTDFNGHTAPYFWKQRMGRLGVSGSCSVMPPAFEVGHTYVLLLGVRPDTKQFEEVTPQDKWLLFIKHQLAGG